MTVNNFYLWKSRNFSNELLNFILLHLEFCAFKCKAATFHAHSNFNFFKFSNITFWIWTNFSIFILENQTKYFNQAPNINIINDHANFEVFHQRKIWKTSIFARFLFEYFMCWLWTVFSIFLFEKISNRNSGIRVWIILIFIFKNQELPLMNF